MERSPLSEKIYQAGEAFGRVSRDNPWNDADALYLWGYYRGIEGYEALTWSTDEASAEESAIFNEGFEDGKGDRDSATH